MYMYICIWIYISSIQLGTCNAAPVAGPSRSVAHGVPGKRKQKSTPWAMRWAAGFHGAPKRLAKKTALFWYGVSINGGTPSHPFLDGIFLYKPSILGYPHFRNLQTCLAEGFPTDGSRKWGTTGHWTKNFGELPHWTNAKQGEKGLTSKNRVVLQSTKKLEYGSRKLKREATKMFQIW